MANDVQLEILKQGVEVWNRWRQAHPGEEIDLSHADLSRVPLAGADLHAASLIGADLTGVDLTRANLREAGLVEAGLMHVDFTRADLSEACLDVSDLLYAVFRGTRLVHTTFWEATLGGTLFTSTDLGTAEDLDRCQHRELSTIGRETLSLSRGRIPPAFLRGCGFSDWEIISARLFDPDLGEAEIGDILNRLHNQRLNRPVQIAPVYICYSHEDREFVDHLADRLTQRGIRYWLDTHGGQAGRLEKQIDRAVRQNPTVLLVLSEHSLESDWLEAEVRADRALGLELRRNLLHPVTVDESWRDIRRPRQLMEQLLQEEVVDFCGWQDPAVFTQAFARLADGLELFYAPGRRE